MPDVLGWWQRLPWHRFRFPAVVVLVGFAAVGVWRVESTARRAEATVDQLAEVIAQLEAERVDRCIEGRGDTRRAIVRVVDEFTDLDPAEVDEVSAAVAEEIPTAACTRTPP